MMLASSFLLGLMTMFGFNEICLQAACVVRGLGWNPLDRPKLAKTRLQLAGLHLVLALPVAWISWLIVPLIFPAARGHFGDIEALHLAGCYLFQLGAGLIFLAWFMLGTVRAEPGPHMPQPPG